MADYTISPFPICPYIVFSILMALRAVGTKLCGEPFPFFGISTVISVGANNQMIRTYAQRCVTSMSNQLTFCDGPYKFKITISMCSNSTSVHHDSAIISGSTAGPQPALSLPRYLTQKSCSSLIRSWVSHDFLEYKSLRTPSISDPSSAIEQMPMNGHFQPQS